jgi:hypothetical protein
VDHAGAWSDRGSAQPASAGRDSPTNEVNPKRSSVFLFVFSFLVNYVNLRSHAGLLFLSLLLFFLSSLALFCLALPASSGKGDKARERRQGKG